MRGTSRLILGSCGDGVPNGQVRMDLAVSAPRTEIREKLRHLNATIILGNNIDRKFGRKVPVLTTGDFKR